MSTVSSGGEGGRGANVLPLCACCYLLWTLSTPSLTRKDKTCQSKDICFLLTALKTTAWGCIQLCKLYTVMCSYGHMRAVTGSYVQICMHNCTLEFFEPNDIFRNVVTTIYVIRYLFWKFSDGWDWHIPFCKPPLFDFSLVSIFVSSELLLVTPCKSSSLLFNLSKRADPSRKMSFLNLPVTSHQLL